MGIAEEIRQKKFKSELSKALINIIYTNGWLLQKQVGVFKPHGLTNAQFNVLRILRGQFPNPSTINLLIERMLDKSSNASRIIDKLELKDLVERRQCSGDRRAVDVIISQSGLDLLQIIDLEMTSLEESINKLSEKECESLNNLLDKLRS
ncbi:MAG: DNA-binding MarR family transcriptional regulator [Cyclobacteriaceae bacterium]|jgi:DNA-binding MarR family transcriptional regulator